MPEVHGGILTAPMFPVFGFFTPANDRELAAPVAALRVYIVHEAGELQPDGSQCCHRCGRPILDAAPPGANRALWGFPVSRRVVQGPVCTYLVTVDRQLTSDEVPCT